MSLRSNGGLIGIRKVSTTTEATGVWDLQAAQLARNSSIWPISPGVQLLLLGETDADSSQNNFTVTKVGNATTSTTQKKYGSKSWYFDGSGDYLSIANNAAVSLTSGNFTIEAWVYWTNINAGGTVFNKDGKAAVSYPQYSLQIVSGKMRIDIGSGNGTSSIQTITSSTNFPANEWVHMAVVRNGTNISLYQNGTSVASATQTATMIDGGRALLIGYQDSQPASAYWDGYIDELRLIKGSAIYTANFTPPGSFA